MYRILDWVFALSLYIPLRIMRFLRFRLPNFPRSRDAFRRAGVFPISDHYVDPLFDMSNLTDLRNPRVLHGVEFNMSKQIELLSGFANEPAIAGWDREPEDDEQFHIANQMFEHGDAELWFHVINHFKPARIIEIGSGHSTKVARMALAHLKTAEPHFNREHICIEPHGPVWLKQLGPHVIEERVENVVPEFFLQLEKNDILFIDSSHMIRPQGDVLFEIMQILPTLAHGVIVHFHDIFTPRDYPDEWLKERVYFWNEQYLLEAFLSSNRDWEILLAANMLMHDNFELLKSKCRYLDRRNEPRSFYIRRLG